MVVQSMGSRALGTPALRTPRVLGHRSRNQARPSIVREVSPGPLDENEHAVSKPNQEENVNGQPRDPRREPRKPQPSKLGDRSRTTHGSERAPIAVPEWNRWLTA